VHAAKIVAAVLDGETGQLQTFAMSGENAKAARFCALMERQLDRPQELSPVAHRLIFPSIHRFVDR